MTERPKTYEALIQPFSRRSLLRGATVLPLAAAASRCAPDTHPLDPAYEALPATREGSVFLAQFPKGPDAVEAAVDKLDFSWLRPGDSVLLKVASNSNKPHPATTAPDAVVGMARALKKRGAGRVIMADQAGIEWVRYRKEGQLAGRGTDAIMEGSGLAQAARDGGAEMHTFDSQPFEEGYFAGTQPRISHWKNPVFIPRIVNEVDHILYLPRLSSHAVTGYTMALKLAVGWMRDDARLEFHQKGASLYEKYTQVSYMPEIHRKLRGAFFYVTDLLLDIGPDVGTTVPLPEAVVLHSNHLGDADALGSALLLAFDDLAPSPLDYLGVYPEQANYWNRYLVKYWGSEAESQYEDHRPASFWNGISNDPAIRHAYVLDGEKPKSIKVNQAGTPFPPPIMNALMQYSGGIFSFDRG